VSESLPIGLYKGVSTLTGTYAMFYNEGGTYGWYEYGEYVKWADGEPKWSKGWFQPAVVRWIDLTPTSEFEFLILTGKEFKKPNGV